LASNQGTRGSTRFALADIFRRIALPPTALSDQIVHAPERKLAVTAANSCPTALRAEHRGFVLLAEPLQELLKTSIRQDYFHSIECVTQFVMTPGLVDEILARVAGGYDFSASLAARNHVMAACGHLQFAENAYRIWILDFEF